MPRTPIAELSALVAATLRGETTPAELHLVARTLRHVARAIAHADDTHLPPDEPGPFGAAMQVLATECRRLSDGLTAAAELMEDA